MLSQIHFYTSDSTWFWKCCPELLGKKKKIGFDFESFPELIGYL